MCGFLQLQFDKIPKSVALLTAVLKLNHSLENLQFVCQSELLLLLLPQGCLRAQEAMKGLRLMLFDM